MLSARVLMLLVALCLLVVAVDAATPDNKQSICAKPDSGCGAPKSKSICTQWHGCKWSSSKCVSDTSCSKGKPQEAAPTSKPTVRRTTKSPTSTQSPTLSARQCIDVPQVNGGCSSAKSLHGCEKFFCCTWYSDGKCRPNGSTDLPFCNTFKTKALCLARPYCKYAKNKCTTNGSG